MTTVSFLRHGPTEWNSEKRIQGRTDIALSEAGRKTVAGWRLPQHLALLPVYSSPLIRTSATAAMLAQTPVHTCQDLIEMHWGQFEGHRLSDLRREFGESMAENESRGLDFRPPGGESPRDVQIRVTAWASGLEEASVVAVTHKGVIRAMVAAALGWDMCGKAPVRLQWEHVHTLTVSKGGSVSVVLLNEALG